MPYLNRVMLEALRFAPPVENTTPLSPDRDIQVGKFHLKKGQ